MVGRAASVVSPCSSILLELDALCVNKMYEQNVKTENQKLNKMFEQKHLKQNFERKFETEQKVETEIFKTEFFKQNVRNRMLKQNA